MQRPAAVSILGILNILFGFLALFGAFRDFGALSLQATGDDSKNPAARIMHEIPAYATMVKWTIPLGFLSFALLLIAGIGLLRMGEWARKLSIAYGICAILTVIAEAAITFVLIFGPAHAAGSYGAPDVIAAAGPVMEGVYYGLIYPVTLIYFMTRREIAAAFRPPEQSAAVSPVR